MGGIFPTGTWNGARVTFQPYVEGESYQGQIGAVLVFAFHNQRIVLADVADRGWCIPSGRLLPGETAEAAARRECWEEAGLTLETVSPLGFTHLEGNDGRPVRVMNYLAKVARIDPIPQGYESRGIRLAARDELPECYCFWDDLMSSVFDFAWERMSAERNRQGASNRPNG